MPLSLNKELKSELSVVRYRGTVEILLIKLSKAEKIKLNPKYHFALSKIACQLEGNFWIVMNLQFPWLEVTLKKKENALKLTFENFALIKAR